MIAAASISRSSHKIAMRPWGPLDRSVPKFRLLAAGMLTRPVGVVKLCVAGRTIDCSALSFSKLVKWSTRSPCSRERHLMKRDAGHARSVNAGALNAPETAQILPGVRSRTPTVSSNKQKCRHNGGGTHASSPNCVHESPLHGLSGEITASCGKKEKRKQQARARQHREPKFIIRTKDLHGGMVAMSSGSSAVVGAHGEQSPTAPDVWVGPTPVAEANGAGPLAQEGTLLPCDVP